MGYPRVPTLKKSIEIFDPSSPYILTLAAHPFHH
jgi:hypothetical protein